MKFSRILFFSPEDSLMTETSRENYAVSLNQFSLTWSMYVMAAKAARRSHSLPNLPEEVYIRMNFFNSAKEQQKGKEKKLKRRTAPIIAIDVLSRSDRHSCGRTSKHNDENISNKGEFVASF